MLVVWLGAVIDIIAFFITVKASGLEFFFWSLDFNIGGWDQFFLLFSAFLAMPLELFFLIYFFSQLCHIVI